MKKTILFISKYSLFDFCRKVFFNISIKLYNFSPLRNLKGYYHFKKWNIVIGKNLNVYGQIFHIEIGKGVHFYDNVIIEFSPEAIFKIGCNSLLSYGVLVCCRHKIIIGNDVQIGEYTSIRDSTHDYKDYGLPIKYNTDIVKDIIIGNNVWIGRGCIVLPGTIIEDGVVVGANSVIKGHLFKNTIYAGAPLKKLNLRIA
jgi:acetyltransferase-like isoleucine patch superfamily enzyme